MAESLYQSTSELAKRGMKISSQGKEKKKPMSKHVFLSGRGESIVVSGPSRVDLKVSVSINELHPQNCWTPGLSTETGVVSGPSGRYQQDKSPRVEDSTVQRPEALGTAAPLVLRKCPC